MSGPRGATFVYTRRERLKDLDPNYIGWHGVQASVARRPTSQQDLFGKPFNIEETIPAPDATMFEGGSWGVISIVGAKAALELALKHDQTVRSQRVLKVTENLMEGLKKKCRKIT